MVEDSKTDLFLIREAIETAGIQADVDVLQDGYAATEYLVAVDADETAPCPDVILLDLNLPKKSGHEVLRRIETGSRCRSAKVLIVSSSDAASDRALVDMFGVSGYFKKPSNYDDFMKLGPMICGLLNSGRDG